MDTCTIEDTSQAGSRSASGPALERRTRPGLNLRAELTPETLFTKLQFAMTEASDTRKEARSSAAAPGDKISNDFNDILTTKRNNYLAFGVRSAGRPAGAAGCVTRGYFRGGHVSIKVPAKSRPFGKHAPCRVSNAPGQARRISFAGGSSNRT
ncbi:hypothetical protein EVAR_88688_1 [Eumeta japonica]|uniref:Uncharacterized protein n=1 Tax=Eumeta variegata TaxID=151549 RepID=A0A4C1Y442_EUMVA|nr:hypothetical protein EVAR_88688_1 [Eumeta japonica]